MTRSTRIEKLNDLAFLVELQGKVWKYHPDNPKAVNVKEEYISLQKEIDEIEKELSDS
ncbi:MAG: hypothetical protein GY936_14890 [Ignavibacteriae bacterium]|nr:hypothetical protein [Ignavibacteriota bacterium]|tara:strand:- start:184 stop:357 length:174 start_codon:yes stop_codon:yes gene_type:complete